MDAPDRPCCPVCRAKYRGERCCPRCGADLAPLMRLLVRAWRFRNAAREALAAGDARRATDLAGAAGRVASTPAGRRLALVARWLGAS